MAFKINKWQKFLTESKDIGSSNQKDLFSPSMDYDQQLLMLNEGFYDIIKNPKAALAALKDKAYEKYIEKFIMIANGVSDKAQSVKDVIQEYFPVTAQTAALTAIGFAIASMGKPDVAIRIMSGDVNIGDITSLLAALAEKKNYAVGRIDESFAPLMQSNDLDSINQAIDLAISMEEFPEPDKIKYVVGQSHPTWGRLFVYYEGKESPEGDAFEEWLKQYMTVVADWENPGEDVVYSRFESDNRGGRTVFTIRHPVQLDRLTLKLKEGMWPMENFLQSDDLAMVNQGIDLAVMMGDIPDPDNIKMYPDKFNKLLIQYTSAEDGDRFIEWLEQNGVHHEESSDVYAGKPFYGASRRKDYFRSTPEKMNQRMPGYSRIRIHIATGDEGFEIGPLTGASTLGIRGV